MSRAGCLCVTKTKSIAEALTNLCYINPEEKWLDECHFIRVKNSGIYPLCRVTDVPMGHIALAVLQRKFCKAAIGDLVTCEPADGVARVPATQVLVVVKNRRKDICHRYVDLVVQMARWSSTHHFVQSDQEFGFRSRQRLVTILRIAQMWPAGANCFDSDSSRCKLVFCPVDAAVAPHAFIEGQGLDQLLPSAAHPLSFETFDKSVTHSINNAFKGHRMRATLLVGPEGTGKLFFIRQLSQQLGCQDVFVTEAKALFSYYVGQAQVKLSGFFKPRCSPDAISMRVIEDVDQLTDVQLMKLQAQIDHKPQNVLFLATTTSALFNLGPVIFEHVVEFNTPSAPVRVKILLDATRMLRIRGALSQTVDFSAVVKLTPGYCGSHLNSLVKVTTSDALEAVIPFFGQGDMKAEESGISMTVQDFVDVLYTMEVPPTAIDLGRKACKVTVLFSLLVLRYLGVPRGVNRGIGRLVWDSRYDFWLWVRTIPESQS